MLHNSPCPTPQPTHTLSCPEVPYHLTKQLYDPQERHQGAGVLRLPPPRPGRRGRRPHGLVDLQPVILRRWVHVNRGVDAVLVVGIVVAVGVGGEGGGGEEAHGIPGGGEEDEDRGQEGQCWADEAHDGWEEKEGGSISGRDLKWGPGGGLGAAGDGDGQGRGRPHGRCPPRACFGGRVLLPSSRPPLPSIVAGRAPDGDYKWQSNMI